MMLRIDKQPSSNEAAQAVHLSNMATNMMAEGQLETALVLYRRACAIAPNDQRCRSNLAGALTNLNYFEEARALALTLPDDDPNAHMVRGQCYISEGKFSEGLAHLMMGPPSKDRDLLFALTTLLAGDWLSGWNLYAPMLTDSGHAAPQWDGAPVKSLLVYHEQGLGDTLQFCRYVEWATSKARRITLMLPPALAQVIGAGYREAGVHVAHRLEDVGPVEAQIGLLGLPRLYCTTPSHVPAVTRCVRFVPIGPLSSSKKRRVGIVWAGNPKFPRDRHRSMPFEVMLQLAADPGLELYSLQIGPRAADIGRMEAQTLVKDLAGAVQPDMAYLAGAIRDMDAVVTVDTATAHLAGTMDKPTFVCLPKLPDWRWGWGGDRTPWYKSVRLFRQPEFGDWDSVIRDVRAGVNQL